MNKDMKKFLDDSESYLDDVKIKLNQDLADKFLFPFCEKWGLRFLQGNGTFIFFNHNNKSLKSPFVYNLPKNTTFLKEYHEICDLLNGMFSLIKMHGIDY